MNRTKFGKIALGTAFAGAAIIASSTAFAGRPMSSIADSWHNLGSQNTWTVTPSGNPVANHSNDTAEICVFCHTPHGGDNTAAVPIWNRKLNDPTAYKRSSSLGSSTFDVMTAARLLTQ